MIFDFPDSDGFASVFENEVDAKVVELGGHVGGQTIVDEARGVERSY